MKPLVILGLSLALAACDARENPAASAPDPAESRPVIYTVSYPLAFIAGRLVGDAARVEFPAPLGVDPAYWQPDVDTVLMYQQADLVLLNGAGYARWVAMVSLPASKLVDTSAAYVDTLIRLDGGPVHSHGPTGDHSHGEVAFTTWLDFSLARQQVAAVASALLRTAGLAGVLKAEEVERRAAVLDAELAALDAAMLTAGAELDGAPVLFSHPVYQYLARRYALDGRSLHWEPALMPGPAEWEALDTLLAEHPAGLMLWEAEPLAEVAAELNRRGVEVVVFGPMTQPVAGMDFLAGMQGNVARLARAL